MTLGNESRPRPEDGPPATNKGLMAAAGVLLALPIIALMWVPSYAREDPAFLGFPFFFWYQFLWVFLCSAMTYAAYRLTLAARRTPTDRTAAPPSDPATDHGHGHGHGHGATHANEDDR